MSECLRSARRAQVQNLRGPVTEGHFCSKQSAVIRHQSRYNIPVSAQGIISLPKKIKSDVHEDQGRNCSFLRRCSAVHVCGRIGRRSRLQQRWLLPAITGLQRSAFAGAQRVCGRAQHPAGDRWRTARPARVAGPQLQLPDRRRVQRVQGQSDRGERRDRSSGVQALWLCRGHLGNSRRSR